MERFLRATEGVRELVLEANCTKATAEMTHTYAKLKQVYTRFTRTEDVTQALRGSKKLYTVTDVTLCVLLSKYSFRNWTVGAGWEWGEAVGQTP